MKTAISVPDNIFYNADNLAKKLHISRSELYANAVLEYIEIHKKDNITKLLNKVYSEEENPSSLEQDIIKLQSKSISEEKW